ncbi:MAG: ArnT family glycosyltransferase [Chthoniobacteraceae bacterium]
MNLPPVRSKTLYLIAFAAILIFFASSLTTDIDRPWVNQIDFNGAVWSQAAHNILRAGLFETQGASTAFYFGPLPIPNRGYYLHHPPLLHLAVAAMFAVFGEHEWAARAVPIACMMASVVLLWLLVNSTLGPRTATFTAAAFVGLPMTLRYGPMVNFEPMVLTLILLALLSLRYWQATGRSLWKYLFFGALLTGMWVDWAMHLFAIVIFAWWMTRPGRPQRRLAWAVLLVTALSGALYLIHTQILRPDALKDLQNTFLVRVASDEKYKFTFGQWLFRVSRSALNHYLWIGIIPAVIGAAVAWKRRHEEGFRWMGWAAFTVAAMDAIFVGVFQNDSYIHEYIAFYFIMPVAVMIGIALNEASLATERLGKWRALGYACVWIFAIVAIGAGEAQTTSMAGRFCILDPSSNKAEPETLIPQLGAAIRKHFSPKTRVLCNFMPYYGPHLLYYAEREMAPNLADPRDWKPYIQENKGTEMGGIVWMGDDDAPAIIANLPPGKKEFVRLENESFCVWTPGNRRF